MNTTSPNNPALGTATWTLSAPRRWEQWLQICIAAMAVLGTLLLGMGKREYWAAAWAVPIAISAVYLVDIKRWVRINLLVANVAGVLLAIQLWYALNVEESKLIALADSLVYLQFVLLFCTKTTRIYWYLVLLSLLQVAVASAINLGFLFGIVFLLYLQATLTALALFYLIRESQRLARPARHRGDATQKPAATPRWPLSGAEAGFSGRIGDGLDRAALRTLTRKTLGIAAGCVIVSAAVFIALPRLGQSPWATTPLNPQRVVGFTDAVTLGSLGAVSEDPQEVMKVRFTHHATRESYRLAESPLFRGVVLTTYRRGEWLRARTARTSDMARAEVVKPEPVPSGRELVDQSVALEPLETPIVFSMYPAIATRPIDGLMFDDDDVHGRRWLRIDPLRQQRAEYKLVLTGVRNGVPEAITPIAEPLETYAVNRLLQLPADSQGVDPLAEVKNVARQQITAAGATDRIAQARTLERFLRETGGFTYSMLSVNRDPNLDPVEDFVLNNRRGHCEYFASCLSLMLRSLDIPSRVVVGFRGDEYNGLGDFYQVRQLHSHAWVEAYLGQEDLPAGLRLPTGQQAKGAWLRLDPTASAADIGRLRAGWFGLPGVAETLDFCQFLWSRYILEMDAGRQRQAVYGPLASMLGNLFRKPFSADTYADLGQGISVFFQLMLDSFRQGRWFNWRGGLTAVIVLLAAAAVWRLSRLTKSAVKAWLSRERSAARAEKARRVEFYHRMESLLARHFWTRDKCQTQREFAADASGALAGQEATQQVADLPPRIVDLFYRLRFGETTVDQRAVSDALSDLDQLRAALEPNGPRRRKPKATRKS